MNSVKPRNNFATGILLLLLSLTLAACLREAPENPSRSHSRQTQPASPSSALHPLAQAVDAIERINAMRSTLAAGLVRVDTITEATFNQVCRPVGQRLRMLARQHGWEVRQIAIKYRNPAHKPEPEDLPLFALFEQDTTLHSLTREIKNNAGVQGYRYVRRITVEPGCLACHGPRESRPAFIKQKYPDDRAYDFKVDDLRGLYSVFIPRDSVRMAQ